MWLEVWFRKYPRDFVMCSCVVQTWLMRSSKVNRILFSLKRLFFFSKNLVVRKCTNNIYRLRYLEWTHVTVEVSVEVFFLWNVMSEIFPTSLCNVGFFRRRIMCGIERLKFLLSAHVIFEVIVMCSCHVWGTPHFCVTSVVGKFSGFAFRPINMSRTCVTFDFCETCVAWDLWDVVSVDDVFRGGIMYDMWCARFLLWRKVCLKYRESLWVKSDCHVMFEVPSKGSYVTCDVWGLCNDLMYCSGFLWRVHVCCAKSNFSVRNSYCKCNVQCLCNGLR